MKWEDATTYSRSDRERKQTAWRLDTEHVQIWISNLHHYYPDEWVYICRNVGVNEAKSLKLKNNVSPEIAQKKAVEWVHARLKKMLNSLP